MGIFRRASGAAEVRKMVDSFRGQLDAELWEKEESHEPYFDRAMELEAALAEAILAQRREPDPLTAGQRKRLNQMRQVVAPDNALPEAAFLLGGAAESALLLARAEDWSGVDLDTLGALVDESCREAGETTPRAASPFRRITIATASVIARHANPEAPPQATKRLYDYVAALPAFQRLMQLGQFRAHLDSSAWNVHADGFELLFERAWHAGLAVWLFEEAFSPLRTLQSGVLSSSTT